MSIWETEAAFQPNTVVLSERQIKGTIGYRNVYPAVMELMTRGYFQAANLVTKRIELDDIVTEGFDVLSSEKSQVKILVKAPSKGALPHNPDCRKLNGLHHQSQPTGRELRCGYR